LIIPAYLKIQNPLRLPDCFQAGWPGFKSVSFALQKAGIINATQMENLMSPGLPHFRRLEAMIMQAGFDGIVYRNEYEVDGRVPAKAGDFRIRENPSGKPHRYEACSKMDSLSWCPEEVAYGGGKTPEEAIADAIECVIGGWNIYKDSYIVFSNDQVRFALMERMVETESDDAANDDAFNEAPRARERMR
jgi:hypothetical protein